MMIRHAHAQHAHLPFAIYAMFAACQPAAADGDYHDDAAQRRADAPRRW